MVYASKGELRPMLESAIGVSGGLLGLAAGGLACGFIAGTLSQMSSQFLATFIHFAVEMLAGGIAQNVVIGAGDIVLIIFFEPEELKGLTSDEIETLLYEKIVKDIPILGALYSFSRGITYTIKDDKETSVQSFWDCFANTTGSAVGLFGATAAHHFTPQVLAYAISGYEDDIARIAVSAIQKSLTVLGKGAGATTKFGLKTLGENADKAKYL